MDFFIKGLSKDKEVIIYFRRSIRVIDNLDNVNILVGIDVLGPKEITPNITKKIL